MKTSAKSAAARSTFSEVHAALRKLLEPVSRKKGMKLAKDGPAGCVLLGPPHPKWPQYPGGLWFAATRVGKAYVSFHLMPVYMCPSLRALISPALGKRMQGKSCFNFREVDPVLFRELGALTKAAYAEWRNQGYV